MSGIHQRRYEKARDAWDIARDMVHLVVFMPQPCHIVLASYPELANTMWHGRGIKTTQDAPYLLQSQSLPKLYADLFSIWHCSRSQTCGRVVVYRPCNEVHNVLQWRVSSVHTTFGKCISATRKSGWPSAGSCRNVYGGSGALQHRTATNSQH